MPFNPDGSWTSKNGRRYGPNDPRPSGADQEEFSRDLIGSSGLSDYSSTPEDPTNPAGQGQGLPIHKSLRDFWSGLSGFMMGDGSKPGLLGGTRDVAQPYGINAGAYGIPGHDSMAAMLAQGRGAAGKRQIIDMQNSNQMRGVQTDLIQRLQAQARGEGPSLAQMQLQKGSDQNIAQMMGAAASVRGPGQAAQQKSAMNQGAVAGQQMAGDSAMLRLQEQMQANNMLAGVSGQARAQDISSQGLNLQQQAQNDDLVKFYTQAGLSLEQAQQQAKQALEELRVKQQIEFEKLRGDAYNNGGYSKGIGAVAGLLGAM